MTKPTPAHTRTAAIADHLNDGASFYALARRYHVSEGTVRRWVYDATGRQSVKSGRKREDGSPAVYEGGWEWRNGVAYPLEGRSA